MHANAAIATRVAVWIATLVLSSAATAANLDYETEPLGLLPSGTDLAIGVPAYYYVGTTGLSAIEDGVGCAPSCPSNATKYHRNFNSGFGNIILIKAEPGGVCAGCDPFDLLKIDIAESDPSSGPVNVLIVAFGAGAPPPMGFLTDGIADGPGGQPDFQTLTLPATYVNLDAVSLSSATPGLGIAIDNIVVDGAAPVPALSPLALAALALTLVITASAARRSTPMPGSTQPC